MYKAAKETVTLAECQLISEDGNTIKFDSAWQELLNHANLKFGEAEKEKRICEQEHLLKAAEYFNLQQKISSLYNDFPRAITKAKPFYDLKRTLEARLKAERQNAEDLHLALFCSKQKYKMALQSLEQISEQVHRQRQMTFNLPMRTPGVGAECDSLSQMSEMPSASIDIMSEAGSQISTEDLLDLDIELSMQDLESTDNEGSEESSFDLWSRFSNRLKLATNAAATVQDHSDLSNNNGIDRGILRRERYDIVADDLDDVSQRRATLKANNIDTFERKDLTDDSSWSHHNETVKSRNLNEAHKYVTDDSNDVPQRRGTIKANNFNTLESEVSIEPTNLDLKIEKRSMAINRTDDKKFDNRRKAFIVDNTDISDTFKQNISDTYADIKRNNLSTHNLDDRRRTLIAEDADISERRGTIIAENLDECVDLPNYDSIKRNKALKLDSHKIEDSAESTDFNARHNQGFEMSQREFVVDGAEEPIKVCDAKFKSHSLVYNRLNDEASGTFSKLEANVGKPPLAPITGSVNLKSGVHVPVAQKNNIQASIKASKFQHLSIHNLVEAEKNLPYQPSTNLKLPKNENIFL